MRPGRRRKEAPPPPNIPFGTRSYRNRRVSGLSERANLLLSAATPQPDQRPAGDAPRAAVSRTGARQKAPGELLKKFETLGKARHAAEQRLARAVLAYS